VDHGRGRGTEGAVAALRAARLEPLWRHRPLPGSPWSLSVARRPPEKRKLSLTVGMIAMNEEAAVGAVIDSVKQHAPEAEILLVDSSKDRTPIIAESKGARVIRQFPPRGYGPAMTRLLYETTTDVIVTIDCDGTYPVERIRELHSLVEGGLDIVNASRTHKRPKAMPIENFMANRVFVVTAALLHNVWTTDLHSGMRAYRTSMLRGMYVADKGAALPVELLLVPTRHGYHFKEVNIEYFLRIGETTLNRWDSTKWTFRRMASAARTGGTKLT
jgi:glycosyltransferase involved in cell wall biosynthesis